MLKSLVIFASVSASTIAAAQPAQPSVTTIAPAPAEKENSINISPLGLLFGSYALGYEHLFDGEHGLIVEGTFSRSSGDNSSSYGVGGAIGYRWHWRGKQNSGFLGLTAAQSFGHGEGTVDVDGGMETFGVAVRATSVTANIGKRWMITDNLNATIRFGLGWAHYSVEAETDNPDAKKAEKIVNDALALFPVGIDGELSLGYTF